METVSILYEDYPVLINSDDVEKYCGCILSEEIEGDSEEKVSNFLDTVHQQIYDFLIYATGDRDIKDRIITKYAERLTKPITKALLVQAKYLLASGDIALFNGVIKTVNGVDIKDNNQITEKVIGPTVINLLIGTKPNILFAGR
ncbi:MAG: hypothetical protein IJQ23_01435 [Clostridia bacterium]|nr:hypothetical protein [Clostridia bacterium]